MTTFVDTSALFDQAVHGPAVSEFLAATRGAGIRTAFAFDRDFAAQGFKTVP